MDVRLLESLDRGIEQGGVAVAAKALAPGGKPGKALLEELKEKGYLKSEDGKKFEVTEAGWEAWLAHARPERRDRLRAAALGKLLEAVKASAGKKKLKPKDLAACPERWRNEAFERKFLQEVKPDVYQLLPAGEDFLESLLPVSEQLERRQAQYRTELEALQEESRKVSERVTSLREKLLPECERLQRELGDAAAGLKQELMRAVEEQQHSAREATETLRGAATLALLAQQIRARAEEVASAALEKVEGRLRELREPMEDAERLKSDVAAMQSALSNHVLQTETELARLSREVASRPSESTETGNGTVPSGPSEAAVLAALRKAHEEIDASNPALGGTVRIPDLYDRLQDEGVIDDLETFHRLLMKWEGEDQLRLRVYDDPHGEPRRAEGIESGRGLLFYVRLK
jgi:hypothetical protein